ncbi:MAG: MFS transporter [Legionellaceae bacterium]|nr:MFS transporter [Legionellaceae bacterium]HAF87936.1 MFS transporter [Legionellales bacterium]|tara:strand:- start:640 stop:1929 length:1290 start_codon:yes stop_codon:yes gene_type:complete
MSALLQKRTFLPLFLTQFFGAFNDNAFKLSMLTLISYHISCSQTQSEHYQALAGALFTLPFFLFSATAGQLADKFNKTLLTRLIKLSEIALMALGSMALITANIPWMLITLSGLGIHSTFFGPIKYAILPEYLPRQELLKATGWIEASTFIAILLGTVLGTLAIGNIKGQIGHALLTINIVAVIGFIASLYMPTVRPTSITTDAIDWHVWRATKTIIVDIARNRVVFPAVLAISWFWLIGAVMLTKLPDYTHYVLKADTSVFAFFLSLFSIGIAMGSLTISRLLKSDITLRYVPLSMLGLSFFALELYWATPLSYTASDKLLSLGTFLTYFNHWRITIDFFLFSFSGGLFVVPLYTYLQISTDERHRGRIIAGNNIYNALSMVLGSLVVMLMLQLHLTIAAVFLVLAIANTFAAIILEILILFRDELNA